MGRHDHHDARARRRRIVRAAVWVVAVAALLVGANAAAGAWIGTSVRPTLEPAPTKTPAATRSATHPPSVKKAKQITLAFTGDMLASDKMLAQARNDAGGTGYDFDPMLAQVAPILRKADWAICHQETPVSDNDKGVHGYPRFNAPYELAAAEQHAGYDACDTASNHTADLGAGGVVATLGTLDKYRIEHTGSARTQAEAARPTIYNVHGVKVGHLAYTYGLNGLKLPEPWMVNIINVGWIRQQAHRLKSLGADIVVVSVHDGIEQNQTPSADQLRIDSEIMQSPDVDLIVGAHAHVVQPIKKLSDGRWIVYGVGNFLAQQDNPNVANRDGVIVEPTFTYENGRYRITRMGYVPTFVATPGDVVELAPPDSQERTVKSLSAMGAPLVDLTPR